ncbi:hypothetical protein LEP1GSC034_2717 [Leptospira interrogans str. 2003000735]|uniref:Uncharacterized protein n=1 Tax=Leptospira interrogans serovar Australis str. 200703203 TaxID=1085541 RepID=N1UN96_LEPIR|nr:hypothetical protein LEP1GSC025_0839 [Leptospira interrogans str. 2002000621]EMJ67407.1 hypothetical protein LEP1GSC034_2717 [Leptospira interrogans str. 2003000735]EMJ69466.1 hypothetical protein LEP1GSC033_2168 [Leptospira interrogans str. 2002000632]EMY23260.1 hypothetical protein LEP1GSC115_5056 [Leptospira interrogans serovar Australis str. 200703203]OOB97782.1 hypothetical protein B0192_15040 [Leptospira interrogans serovar Australis]
MQKGSMQSQVIEIKEIEYITVIHNNLTGAKKPGPAALQPDSSKFSYVELDFITKSHLNKKH